MTEDWHGLTYIYRKLLCLLNREQDARVDTERHLGGYVYNPGNGVGLD